jgi:hypothetical protein
MLYVRWNAAAQSAVKGIMSPVGGIQGGVSLHFNT